MIAGSYGKSMFSFVRNRHCLPKWLYHLHSHQQWVRVPVAPHLHQHLVLSVFWILAILISVYSYLVVVLIRNSLMTRDVEHIFIRLFAICIFSLVSCLFRSLPIFKSGCSFSYCWVLRVLCIFWNCWHFNLNDHRLKCLDKGFVETSAF